MRDRVFKILKRWMVWYFKMILCCAFRSLPCPLFIGFVWAYHCRFRSEKWHMFGHGYNSTTGSWKE